MRDLRLSLALVLSTLACDSSSSSSVPDATGGAPGASGTPGTAGTSNIAGAGAGNTPAAGAGGSAGATAGAAGSPGAGGTLAPPPPDSAFTLLFRDDFDALDMARWQLMTHSWTGNLALFSAQPVSVADGNLTLRLLPAPAGTVDDQNSPKQFLGAEVRSRDTLTYGRVRARVKFARGSAVISSLVTIYTPWPADNWNELDIEALGKTPENLQFNAMIYTGPPVTPPVSQSVTPTQDPHLEMLGFDYSAEFHTYTIEWTPAGARFFVDDEPRYTWTRHIDKMVLPQNVLLTIWASSAASWAGPVGADTAQAAAVYDWVEFYRYTP